MCGNTLQRHLNRRGSAVKHVQACLTESKDGESSFHYCGSPVKLVQACLCAENTLQGRFNRRGGGVKYVQACLSYSNDGERSFHYSGRPVKLVQACFMGGRYPTTPFKTAEEVLGSTCKPV